MIEKKNLTAKINNVLSIMAKAKTKKNTVAEDEEKFDTAELTPEKIADVFGLDVDIYLDALTLNPDDGRFVFINHDTQKNGEYEFFQTDNRGYAYEYTTKKFGFTSFTVLDLSQSDGIQRMKVHPRFRSVRYR